MFDGPDFVHDLTYGGDILDLDLDTVWHMYGFTLHELQSDGTLRSKPCKIEFSDDDYTRLIDWYLYDKNLTINRLRYHDRDLYNTIIKGADGMHCNTTGFFDATEPFLLTFDEAKADAELLVKRHSIEYNIGSMLVPMF